MDTTKLYNNKSQEVINLASDSSQGSPIIIFTSNDPNTFMNTPANKQHNSPARTNKKIDKFILRIKKTPLLKEQTRNQSNW